MTVPTYTRIDDTEIDPESALTTTLFHKLRDNCLALLGADGASSSPTITLPGQNLYIKFDAGTDNFTVPAGIGSIQFEVWGSGAASQAGTGNVNLGGSAETRIGTLSVTPGETLTIIVAAGGTFATEATPQNSFIKRGSTILVEAVGGIFTSGSMATGGTGGTGIPGGKAISYSCLSTGFPALFTKMPVNNSSFGSCPSGPGGTYAYTPSNTGSAGGVRIRY